jgi:hypothetical protein
VALSLSIAPGYRMKLKAISLHLSAAPTTSQNLTVTRGSAYGTAYNAVIYSRDLSVGSLTDLYVEFGDNFIFEYNESLTIAYTNTDVVTYGIVAYYEKV